MIEYLSLLLEMDDVEVCLWAGDRNVAFVTGKAVVEVDSRRRLVTVQAGRHMTALAWDAITGIESVEPEAD